MKQRKITNVVQQLTVEKIPLFGITHSGQGLLTRLQKLFYLLFEEGGIVVLVLRKIEGRQRVIFIANDYRKGKVVDNGIVDAYIGIKVFVLLQKGNGLLK